MRSCLKAVCASAARIGLIYLTIVGCGDSSESPGAKGSMRVDPELDASVPAESAKICVDEQCDKAKNDDPWLCPVDTMSVLARTVSYSVQVVDFVNHMPRTDLRAKACRNNDLDCEKPVATFVDSKLTGRVQLELPTGFVGFIALSSDAVDTLLYVTRPIMRDTVDRDITVPTFETIDLLATLLEYTWDMDKGLVVLEVLDCSENPQEGIHFECSESGDGFYMVDGVPFKNQHMTIYDPMSNTAEGGFINVRPGLVQFTAKLGIDDDAMELGRFNVQIRPRTLTIIEIHPLTRASD